MGALYHRRTIDETCETCAAAPGDWCTDKRTPIPTRTVQLHGYRPAGDSVAVTRGLPTGDQRLPTAPCSVVWHDGHPYVLDGEPGIPTPRRWVGLRDDGTPHVLTPDEMQAAGFSVVHNDGPNQKDW